ncbi:hypothetical protein CC1G_01773 [Coprinopsis cinerea okayama7|uniref:Small ribosomal subunit protein mS23 n=1 Tax=Coprinopsis cinerea (strain Okayama-7 / 130 / ATCC MYA-4618 / FGSC 9003) TaxID=240176 RepID=A8N2D4_COPC7|nr:hypothetical protein CC1G_01773 [Coprinopsis cinerea okayama7\|eukprot:XP_001829093.1 hypothetical protein CC1G_01773 [Coprinopsis cinerea okayama7\
MVRRIASQVHQQVSRLMRGGYIKKEPVWFKAVLDNPPLALPPKAPPARTAYDRKPQLAPLQAYPKNPKPLPIYYIEDDLRRQFFRDHPFEAFRPRTLVEADRIHDAHPVKGENWTRLRQRGRNPTPEDAIQYALNLYQYHGVSLSEAYARSVAQFRALRSEHHVATVFAVMEAEALGGTFAPDEVDRTFQKEAEALETWQLKEKKDEGALAARKRWKAIVEKRDGVDQWTKGEEYVRLWKEGVRPDYSPILAE